MVRHLARDQVEPSDPPAVAGILSGSSGTLLVHSREKLQEISTEIHAGPRAFHPSLVKHSPVLAGPRRKNQRRALMMTFVLFLAVAIAPLTIASLFATGTENETDGCKFD